MFKLGITDILENHKLYGGFRFPFVGIGSNSEYFLTYENLKKRLDKKFTYYRQAITSTASDSLPFSNIPVTVADGTLEYKTITNYFEAELRYPLDVMNTFRFGAAFRNDKTVYKSVNALTLLQPNHITNWAFVKAEYVYDNTIDVIPNIKQGLRFKVFGEFHKEIPMEQKAIADLGYLPVPQWNNAWFSVLGFDLRHYQKLYKQITWANRLSFGTSQGTRKLIYYMGAVDNWWLTLKNKFDQNTYINTSNNYAFQTLATPMRGFIQNARNGNSYLLLNSELRIPIFAALSNSPIKSSFIRNFQIVGFADVGTAWEGVTPFRDDNPLFQETYYTGTADQKITIIRIKKYKSPVVAGFGFGLRTTLLGYFIKFDTAWGYDTGELKSPIYYLTFGYDF
jgi:hypothetical protein